MTFPWTFHMIQATKAARLLVKNRSFLASKIAEKKPTNPLCFLKTNNSVFKKVAFISFSHGLYINKKKCQPKNEQFSWVMLYIYIL